MRVYRARWLQPPPSRRGRSGQRSGSCACRLSLSFSFGPWGPGGAGVTPPARRRSDSVPVELGAAEPHHVRPTELEGREVELEAVAQLLAVPGVRPEELLVVRALLVPLGEERAGEVETFPVPALGDHVQLAPDLLLVD